MNIIIKLKKEKNMDLILINIKEIRLMFLEDSLKKRKKMKKKEIMKILKKKKKYSKKIKYIKINKNYLY